MPRAARLFAIAFVCSTPASGGALQAQGVATRIAPGDVIRYTPSPPGPRVRGTVASISGDSLWLDRGSPPSRSLVLRTDIARMERRLPGPNGPAIGAVTGFAIGGPLGVVWGRLICEQICENGESGVGLTLLTTGILGGVGAVTGAIVGAIAFPVRWALASWPTENGATLGASVPFRLPE
jgi:hypothetical protein